MSLLLCLSVGGQCLEDAGLCYWPRKLSLRVLMKYRVYGRDYPVHRTKCLDTFAPEEQDMVRGITSCDTLLAAYWVIRFMGQEIYPTVIGYKSEDNIPFRTVSLRRSLLYFRKHPDADMYEDDEIRVFVKKR